MNDPTHFQVAVAALRDRLNNILHGKREVVEHVLTCLLARGRAFLLACFATRGAGLIRATLLGLIAPVGALGALPIASEMIRARVRPGHVMAFLVGSALLMPWSFGHLADSVGVINALVILIAAIITALFVGVVSGIGAPISQGENLDDTEQESSQLIYALRSAARHAASAVWVYVFISLAVSSAFAAILGAGSIESHLNESARTTKFELSVPLALANIDSDIAITFAGEFWRIGLLSGGILVAIMIGAGWCIGTFAWSTHHLRLRGLFGNLIWVACVLGLAAIMHGTLAPVRPGEADSHGFDMLTKPANVDLKYSWSLVGERTLELARQNLYALTALMALMVFGAIEKRRSVSRASSDGDANRSIDVSSVAKSTPVPRFGIVVAIFLLVVNVYSFYPSPAEFRERIRLQSGNLSDAVSIMMSESSSPERTVTGKGRAMNALDQIDRGLSQLKAAGIVRGRQISNDCKSLFGLSREIRNKIAKNKVEGLRADILRLFQELNEI